MSQDTRLWRAPAILLVILMGACTLHSPYVQSDGAGSSLLSIDGIRDMESVFGQDCKDVDLEKFKPTQERLGESQICAALERLITGYHLNITPANCDAGVTGSTLDVRRPFAGGINFNVERGCDYQVFLGYLEYADQQTATDYLFQVATDDGFNLKKQELLVDQVRLSLTLHPTDLARSIGIFTSTDTATMYQWRDHISFITIPRGNFKGNTYGSKHYKDVMDHTKQPYLQDSPLTIVHETQHFMLHENDGRTPEQDKFIYYQDGQGAFFLEPQLRTKTVAAFIPASMPRTSLFNTYIQSRPEQVLGENIFDEWTAYIAERISLIEATIAGVNVSDDSVSGATGEFFLYATAAMTALLEREPQHLEHKNTKAIFAMHAERTRWIHDESIRLNLPRHERIKGYFAYLRSHPDAAKMRSALKTIYGQAWTEAIIGF